MRMDARLSGMTNRRELPFNARRLPDKKCPLSGGLSLPGIDSHLDRLAA
jgi:hypothetical protein